MFFKLENGFYLGIVFVEYIFRGGMNTSLLGEINKLNFLFIFCFILFFSISFQRGEVAVAVRILKDDLKVYQDIDSDIYSDLALLLSLKNIRYRERGIPFFFCGGEGVFSSWCCFFLSCRMITGMFFSKYKAMYILWVVFNKNEEKKKAASSCEDVVG